jgi:hypothetical protein
LPRFPARIRDPANPRGEFSGFSAAKLRMIPRAAHSIFLLIDLTSGFGHCQGNILQLNPVAGFGFLPHLCPYCKFFTDFLH